MKSMNKGLYDFHDYRAYLQYALPVKGEMRGARVRLASALGCQSGFVSQVLGGLADFSLEHAMTISRFLEHNQEERAFFILLVQLGRAGSTDLKKHFQEQIDSIRLERREITERVVSKKTALTAHDQVLYYSSWHYTAIHMALVNGQLQTRRAMADYFRLSMQKVDQVLRDLISCGLVQEKGEKFIGAYDRLHLPAKSPLTARHHSNWRMRAIAAVDHPRETDLHYSSVMSISKSAAEEIRGLMLNAIQSAEPIIKGAKDEGVYTLAIDLFDNEGL